MTRILRFLVACVLVVSGVSADQYWIAYEGNDFPENEGWTRLWNGPIAERWIEDGALVIDARESASTCEWYEQYPDVVAPEPGELFLTQWRLRIEDFAGGSLGTTVGVFADDRWAVAFHMNNDTIRSAFEPGLSAQFEPDEFHEFELRSPDMRAYELYIDDALAFEGCFWLSLNSNRIGWGETTTGSSSLSRWDYVRFGVVPEPSTTVTMLALSAAFMVGRSKR